MIASPVVFRSSPKILNAQRHLQGTLFFVLAAAVILGGLPGPRAFSQEPFHKPQAATKMVLYHSTGIEDTQQLIDQFRRQYPSLSVENHRLSSGKLLQRIISEVRAGRNLADAYIISGAETWLLKDMGFLAPYASPERARVRPGLMDRQGYWTGILWNLAVLGYNTQMVSPDSVPKRWEDLLQPRWKGLIGLEAEDVTWYIFMQKLMGSQNGKSFMAQLARQQPQLRSGYNLIAQLLVAGEFALAPTARVHRIEQAKKDGAPVDWVAIEPLTPEPPVCVSLPKNAPRPDTGKHFIDFVLSRPAQELLSRLKRIPSRMDAPQPIPRVAQVKLMDVEFDKEMAHYARYAKEYRGIFTAP